MLSLGDADDRPPSRIRGMVQVVWLMERDTSWQSSTDFGMTPPFRRKKATYRGDGSPWMLSYYVILGEYWRTEEPDAENLKCHLSRHD